MADRPRSADRHARPAVLVRPERDGQAEEWRMAAVAKGMTLAAWARMVMDRARQHQTRYPADGGTVSDETRFLWRAVCAICKSDRRCTADLGEYATALPICDGCGHRIEDGWVMVPSPDERHEVTSAGPSRHDEKR